jgi:hypothetical protein
VTKVTPTCNLNCSGVISIGNGALDCATDSCRNEDGCCNASAVFPIAGTKQDQKALGDALKSQIHNPLRLHHVHAVSHKRDPVDSGWSQTRVKQSGVVPD